MYYIGIDVSTKESALCILDGKGKIVRETKLPTDPEIIAHFIDATGLAIERIGLESGCTAAWLFAGLRRYGWPVICIDARHAAAALQAGFRNKNDRNDARGIADLMRVNKYRPVWVKSPEAQREGRLLTARATLQSQLVALENTIRGLLRQEGIGLTDRRTAFEAAVREAIGDDRLLEAAVHPLLETRNAVLQHRAAVDPDFAHRACGSCVSPSDDRARCRCARIARLQGRRRRSPTVLALARRRGAFWLDAARVQLGRGELPRADQQDGRPRSPAAALCRGQPHIAARRGAVVSAQSLGRAPRAARRDPQSPGGAGTQTRGRPARHVERRTGIPVAAY